MLPVLIAIHHAVILGAHAAGVRFQLPFITFDDAECDSRLGTWFTNLLDLIGGLRRDESLSVSGVRALLASAQIRLPIMRVMFVIAPVNMPHKVVITPDGRIPVCDVPADGIFTQEAVKAFGAAYPGVELFHDRLTFVCDLLRADQPTMLFYVSTLTGNDAYFLKRDGQLQARNFRSFLDRMTAESRMPLSAQHRLEVVACLAARPFISAVTHPAAVDLLSQLPTAIDVAASEFTTVIVSTDEVSQFHSTLTSASMRRAGGTTGLAGARSRAATQHERTSWVPQNPSVLQPSSNLAAVSAARIG